MRVNRGDAWQRAGRGRPAASGRPLPLYPASRLLYLTASALDGYRGEGTAAASRRSASSAYSVAPSGSTSSVKAAVAE